MIKCLNCNKNTSSMMIVPGSDIIVYFCDTEDCMFYYHDEENKVYCASSNRIAGDFKNTLEEAYQDYLRNVELSNFS